MKSETSVSNDRLLPAGGKAERTRARIFDRAMELFAERGYAEVSIADICVASAISRATFFIHFPAKASLIGEVSRRLGSAWLSEAAGIGDLPPLEQLQRLADFMFDNTIDPNIITPMLNDFRASFGADTSSGVGEGTMHAIATALIAKAQGLELLTKQISAEDLAHHLIRTTSIQKLLTVGPPDLRKDRNWRLFYCGAQAEVG